MNTRKRTSVNPRTQEGSNGGGGRRSAFGTILHDDPYTAKIQTLLRNAKSPDEGTARAALLELFYRFHLRLPLEEERLGHGLPWNREASRN